MKVLFCASCGRKLSEDAKLCPFCGTTIDRSTEQECDCQSPAPAAEMETNPESNDNMPKNNSVETEPVNELLTSESPSEPEAETESEPIDAIVQEEEIEGPSTGMSIIAFFFPMIGFITALVNLGSNKKKSKRYALLGGLGFLIGFIMRMAAVV